MGRFLGLLALLIGSILIIPAFLAWGYLLRIVEHTIYGSNELPVFDDWSRMFSDGLKYIVSNIIYFIVPLALIILSLVGMGFSARSGSSQTAVYLLLLLVGLILNILVAWFTSWQYLIWHIQNVLVLHLNLVHYLDTSKE